MEAKIEIKETKEINYHDIKIGDSNLSDILKEIYDEAHKVIVDVSYEKQSETPDFTDVDVGAHAIMNMIEKIGGN